MYSPPHLAGLYGVVHVLLLVQLTGRIVVQLAGRILLFIDRGLACGL